MSDLPAAFREVLDRTHHYYAAYTPLRVSVVVVEPLPDDDGGPLIEYLGLYHEDFRAVAFNVYVVPPEGLSPACVSPEQADFLTSALQGGRRGFYPVGLRSPDVASRPLACLAARRSPPPYRGISRLGCAADPRCAVRLPGAVAPIDAENAQALAALRLTPETASSPALTPAFRRGQQFLCSMPPHRREFFSDDCG